MSDPEIPASPLEEAGAEDLIFFENKVRPVLVKHCYKCHSSEAEKAKGGLLLDTREGWQTGGDSGDAIIPGDVEGSLVIEAVHYKDPGLQMPPKYKLADIEIRILEKWVRLGAPDPRGSRKAPVARSSIDIEKGRKFWAFQPLANAKPPSTSDQNWARDSLDAFVLSGLEEKNLKPVAPANREALIRRITYDLIGLPPKPEEIVEFKNDPGDDDDAFARVVDRLLASPQFGERWGRHWLDIVRYAESVGRTRNFPFPHAWRYRDYVIRAFNEDKPYDQFVTEQLAGDLLPTKSLAERNDRRIATGFLALGSQDLNERDARQYTMDVVDEQIDVTGRALMALTTGCARCHDHKFDPIPTSDYYALAGVFKSSRLLNGYVNKQGGNKATPNANLLVKLDTDPNTAKTSTRTAVLETPKRSQKGGEREARLRKRLQSAKNQLDALAQQLRDARRPTRSKARGKRNTEAGAKLKAAALSAPEIPGLASDPPPENRGVIQRKIGDLRELVRNLNAQLNKIRKNSGGSQENIASDYTGPLAMGVSEAGQIGNCRINIRGEASNLGEEIPRGFLQVVRVDGLNNDIPYEASGRLELARWITSPQNPLTPRVMVNRIWHHLFGRGLVRTVDNFGETGERPTHPGLLDHLAGRFIANDWSVKKTIRQIVLSSTYRMSSLHDEVNYDADPSNDSFWRMNVRRLEVEAIRDAMLAVGGNLDLNPADGSFLSTGKGGEPIGGDNGEGLLGFHMNKRSVYLPIVRNNIPEVMETFDFAEPSSVTGRRDVTTVSTQALFMMNGPFVIEQARGLAKQILISEKLTTDPMRVTEAYRRTLGRQPSGEEIGRALEFIRGVDDSVSNADTDTPGDSDAAIAGDSDADHRPAEIDGKPHAKAAMEAWTLFAQALLAGAEFRYVQ